MKKRLGIALLLGFFALLYVGVSQSMQCLPSDKDACYNNFPLSSLDGFGAAEICGTCYRCGDMDGVCPEDFANESNAVGNCGSCNDIDCNVTISGKVYMVESMIPLEGALVKAVATNPHLNSWNWTTHTLADGSYKLYPPSGRIILSASKAGYDTEINEITLTSRQLWTMDFYLPNASCSNNCTNYYNRCNKDCEGMNGCHYADYDPLAGYSRIAELCHERRLGETVTLNQSWNETFNAVCCRGDEQYAEKTPPLNIGGKMKNLVTTEIPALYNGKPVQLVVAVWQ
jgi:hypothetical protein